VTRLAVTAIKGFALRHPASVILTGTGAVGNREFLLVDEDDELLSVTRSGAFLPYWSTFDPAGGTLTIGRGRKTVLSAPARPGGPVRAHLFGDRFVEGVRVDGPWQEVLSAIAGQPVRLVRAREPSGGYDVHPVTVMAQASAAALGTERDGAALDGRRFRMLLTVDGLDAFGEDRWEGTEVTVGSATLRIGGPVPRCAAIQRHPDDPGRAVNALRRINEVRGPQPSESGRTLNLGVYATVSVPGTVSVGDPLLPVPVTTSP
jgi:hypothetical protein